MVKSPISLAFTDDDFVMLGVPIFSYMAVTSSIDDLQFSETLINMKDPDDHDEIDALVSQLGGVLYNSVIFKRYEVYEKFAKGSTIVDSATDVMLFISMILGLFALSASMSMNLYDERKQMGVLRATGMTKYRIRLLFFYEAFILVASSSILGVLIGCAIGYTMLA